jgi:hypothetical protein
VLTDALAPQLADLQAVPLADLPALPLDALGRAMRLGGRETAPAAAFQSSI